jgi:hypothetical protein
MEMHGIMSNKVSTCLYIDKSVLETAKQMGLNISKVSENALVEAIARLSGPKQETALGSPARGEGRGRDSNPGACILNLDLQFTIYMYAQRTDTKFVEINKE